MALLPFPQPARPATPPRPARPPRHRRDAAGDGAGPTAGNGRGSSRDLAPGGGLGRLLAVVEAQGDRAREMADGGAAGRLRSAADEVAAELWPETVSPTAAWVPQRPVAPPVVPVLSARALRSVPPGRTAPPARPAWRASVGQLIERLAARVALPRGWGGLRWVPSRPAVVGVTVVLFVAVLMAALMVWRSQPSAQAAPKVDRRLPIASAPGAGGAVATGAAGVTTGTGASVSAAGAGTASSAGADAGAASGSSAPLLVHVVGAVRRPGLVQLHSGARVVDAVRAAGGFHSTARRASVNLARVLLDGEQLVVQRRGGPVVVGAVGSGAGLAAGAGTDGSGGWSTTVGAGAAAGAGGAGTTGSVGALAAPLDLNAATVESLDALPGIGPVLAQRIITWRTAHGRFSSVEELGEVSGIGESTLADLRPVVHV